MPEQLILRDRQLKVIDELRDNFRHGARTQLLYAPTGAGKTIVAAHLAQQARAKMTRTAFLADRVNLIDQTSATFDRFGIDHGIVQAKHWRARLYEPIQICSAQTIEKRGFFPDLSLLINDEAHEIRKATSNLILGRESLKVVGLSATPFSRGLGTLYESLVSLGTTDDLIAEGLLAPIRSYMAIAPNMAKARVVAGEWNLEDVEERGMAIVGDIVQEWSSKTTEHFGGPVKTIVFCATVAHGEEICRQFAVAGQRFELISYMDSDDHKRKIIEEFRPKDTQIVGLVSCAALQRGFDVADVQCGISAHPYRKSFSAHIQELGRVMRISPGKEYALWLDHSGNMMRFRDDQVHLFAHGVTSLQDSELNSKARKDPEASEVDEIRCPACKFLLPSRVRRCPACGHEKVKQNTVETTEGSMILVNGELVPTKGKYSWLAQSDVVWAQLMGLAIKTKPDLARASSFALAQYRGIYGAWPRLTFDPAMAVDPSEKLQNLVRSRVIAYAKARQKELATAT